jgi:gamma-glutamyltranspeptidase/glutathione hydrolase
MRNFELPGRSPVMSRGGMAATSNPLATSVAVDVLREGGHAIDAAVAACAVQGVVEPMSTGIGGDCFCLIGPAEGGVIAFNGSGRAPRAATAEWYRAHAIQRIEETSPHAVTVPGAVDAWARLVADHGRFDLGRLLEPAIRYARDGFPVHPRCAFDWQANLARISHDAPAAAVYLSKGKAPRVGDIHRQPALARTLERLAADGRDAFYAGATAEDMVAHLKELGGLHTMDDFAAARGDYVTPIKTAYRGFDVYECPPNGQGIIALMMLNILAGLPLDGLDPLSPERLHFAIEAARIAHRDRSVLLADPEHAEVPVERMLSAAYADEMRALIRPDRAIEALPPSPLAPHTDTVYLCVVDADGNAVSFINSLFQSFGSGICAPRSGVLLHNRGLGFTLDPKHPSCVAPGKRPMHTIIPGLLVEDGVAVMPFGVMGGYYQATGHAHVISNMPDFGLDVQAAIDCPRVFPRMDGTVEMEAGVPEATVARLAALGHRPVKPGKPVGGGQAIWIDRENGVLIGGSDPRKDGCAFGL